jgi:A nuclease of the HNH/ENDO VII superfamily with conserved WHH
MCNRNMELILEDGSKTKLINHHILISRLQELDKGKNEFAILENYDNGMIQTAKSRGKKYIIEYRNSLGELYSASVLNASQVSEIDRWKTAIAEAKAARSVSNNNNNNVGANTAPSATARSGIFLRNEPEFSLSNVVNAASGLAPIYSTQRPNNIGGNINWTPRPDPLPPLPGFMPMPNHGIRLETPIHEPSLLDYVTWTPAAKPEDRFKLPGFDAHDFDEHDMSVLYKKEYPDTVEKIGGRYPINADLAGQKFPLAEKFPELYSEYGDIYFKLNGCPDFSPVTKIEVKVEGLIGDHDLDFKKANEAAGIKELPKGYTWHHHEDGETMQMVPQDLHRAIKHTGGAAKQKHERRL